LLDAGRSDGLVPAGLGARDTLRTEMKYALYGNDIDDAHTPLEAGLGWIVKWDKGDFVGRPALAQQNAQGVRRKLVGFEMPEAGRLREAGGGVSRLRLCASKGRPAGGRGDLGNDGPHGEEGHRHRLRSGGARRRGHPARGRHPRATGSGRGGEDSLQAQDLGRPPWPTIRRTCATRKTTSGPAGMARRWWWE